MGGDGGTLLNQRKLLNRSRIFSHDGTEATSGSSDLAAATAMNNKQRWHFCALTSKPLQLPVVCDLRGDLFNKSAIVDMLLKRKEAARSLTKHQAALDGGGGVVDGGALSHIHKLKDVRELALPENSGDDEGVVIVCPLTKVIAGNCTQPFVVSWTCGHLMCEAAWTSGEPCPLCEDDDGSTFAVRLLLDDEAADKQLELFAGNIRSKRVRETEAS